MSLLLAQFRRLDLAEEALADAVEAAARHWPSRGVPDNPAAWLLTAARRRVLDHIRAEATARRRAPLLVSDAEQREQSTRVMADPGGVIEDDLLRLVMMCAHPSLSPESASALALRLVVGVSTHDIARLFLVPEATMAARLTRAKKKIVTAGIPFSVPASVDVAQRLDIVAQTAYLAFTAGYAPGSGPDLLRAELAGSAISLTRVALSLRPDEPVLVALLALMLFQHSRRDARVGADNDLVLLAEQDRALWHRDEIEEARALLTRPALRRPLTPVAASYVLQARIAAEHALSPSPADTDWARIVTTYDQLLALQPSPATHLARAVAVAESESPVAGLAALEGIDQSAMRSAGAHRLASVQAELLVRTGDVDAACAAYDEAIALCRNDTERAHLARRRAEVSGQDRSSPG
nr:DUF6596 domain-containing protein [Nocardioides daedukensis]